MFDLHEASWWSFEHTPTCKEHKMFRKQIRMVILIKKYAIFPNIWSGNANLSANRLLKSWKDHRPFGLLTNTTSTKAVFNKCVSQAHYSGKEKENNFNTKHRLLPIFKKNCTGYCKLNLYQTVSSFHHVQKGQWARINQKPIVAAYSIFGLRF